MDDQDPPLLCGGMEQVILSAEELDTLRAALNGAIKQLQYIGDRLGRSVGAELSADYPIDGFRTRQTINVPGLRGKIRALLAQAGRPMRSMDITDALYHPNLGISKDKFSRRVIVSVSAMYKEGGKGIGKVDVEGRDALWVFKDANPTGTQINFPLQSSLEAAEPQTVTAPSKATPAP